MFSENRRPHRELSQVRVRRARSPIASTGDRRSQTGLAALILQRSAKMKCCLKNVLTAVLANLVVVVLSGYASAEVLECYERAYSASHLAAHPEQTVTSMHLLLIKSARQFAPDQFAIAVTRRGSSTEPQGAGRCRSNTVAHTLSCYIDLKCDGDCGGVDIEPSSDGSNVLVRLATRTGPGFIDLNNPSGSLNPLRSGVDDRSFRLDIADQSSWENLEQFWNQEVPQP